MNADSQNIIFRISRAKTGRAAIGTLGSRASALVRAYIMTLPGENLPTAQIFRHRSGKPYSKDKLVHDFAAIRGEGETRTLADMRRSAAVEALAGGAHAAQISAKLASSDHRYQKLQPVPTSNHLRAICADGIRNAVSWRGS
jgi:hypothetical protein